MAATVELPTLEVEDFEALPRSRNRVLREFLRDPMALAGLGILVLLVVVSLFAPLIGRYDPNAIDVTKLDTAPTSAHWFGTDYIGRDLWARVVYGGRQSLPAALGVILISAGVGVPLGLAAGYLGRIIDDVFMRVMDILLAFPGLVLAIGIVGILGPSLKSAVVAIGITSIPFFARFVRGYTLASKELEYITAARALSASHARIMLRHILPNMLGPLSVLCAGTFGYAILLTAALSYLGIGAQLPTSDWGVLVFQGYQHMFQSPTEAIFPGSVIVLTVLAVNMLADGLGDALKIGR